MYFLWSLIWCCPIFQGIGCFPGRGWFSLPVSSSVFESLESPFPIRDLLFFCALVLLTSPATSAGTSSVAVLVLQHLDPDVCILLRVRIRVGRRTRCWIYLQWPISSFYKSSKAYWLKFIVSDSCFPVIDFLKLISSIFVWWFYYFSYFLSSDLLRCTLPSL